MSVSKKPMVLVILDGYGYREEQQDNAIFSAKTPVMDALWANRPHTLIDASGLEVGLPDRQMGNSEVGHVNLGAGRIVYQDLTRLDVEIKDRAFFANPVLTGAVDKAKNAGKAVHIMGLLSAGGVHSHEDHIMAMVELAAERGAEKIYLHAFLDGFQHSGQSFFSVLLGRIGTQLVLNQFDQLSLVHRTSVNSIWSPDSKEKMRYTGKSGPKNGVNCRHPAAFPLQRRWPGVFRQSFHSPGQYGTGGGFP